MTSSSQKHTCCLTFELAQSLHVFEKCSKKFFISDNHATVEPPYDKPLSKEDPGITNRILQPSNSKM